MKRLGDGQRSACTKLLQAVAHTVEGELAAAPPTVAAIIVALFAHVALSDEVLTQTEYHALAAGLAQLGVSVDAGSLSKLLEAALDIPRHQLLFELGAHKAQLPNGLDTRLMSALVSFAISDGLLAHSERVALLRIAAALDIDIALPEPQRQPSVVARIHIEEKRPLRIGRSLRADICIPRSTGAAVQLRTTLERGALSFEALQDLP